MLYKLRRMKEEHPRIRVQLEVLEENVEVEILRLGWEMDEDRAAGCDEEE